MDFAAAQEYVASLGSRGWRLGLERMEELVGLANLQTGPPRQFFHVAGTNGKGSTTAFLQSLLQAAGLRTGAFFSPYVYDMRERVQGPGGLISEADFARITTDLMPHLEDLEASEFEAKTAIGFRYWEETNCDAVALEVGLGGRLDATNVCFPMATAIVSIGLDHTAILGDTLEKIAAEKAGIIKPGVPVVIGEMPAVARKVIEQIATERGAPMFEPIAYHAELNLRGARMPHNFGVALAMLKAAGSSLTTDQINVAGQTATCPGRYETRRLGQKTYILDGAHNADSALALAESLARDGHHNLVLVTNVLEGHDPRTIFAPIARYCAQAIVVPINFHRARLPAETASLLKDFIADTKTAESIADALGQIPADSTVLVTGSFYLLGEVNAILTARNS